GWSTKQLLRELLISQTFRQTSNASAASLTKDPENILLGHMNRHRLDFETMHDSLLQLAGKLNESVCGKSVEMFAAPFNTRRALYAFIDRQNLPGILRTFDFALPDTHSPKRFETTVPQQALFMMNSPFVQEQGLAFSKRFENAPDEDARLVAMYRQAYQRQPTSEELSSLKEFIASGPSAGFFQIAQVMLASNEFQFID
ncbi:MAG: DUF1553 domain-containing protein, partial [Planctomycetia bacterium]